MQKSAHKKIFISYAHDDDAHSARVLDLAQRLRRRGFDCIIDQFVEGSPPEGWPHWMEQQIAGADFVLIVGSECYIRRYDLREQDECGAGAKWEGAVVRTHLYEMGGRNRKFIPVIFGGMQKTVIPSVLRGHKIYHLPEDIERLIRVLTGKPMVVPDPIGSVIEDYRQAVDKRAREHDWWKYPIPLHVTPSGSDKALDARLAIRDWHSRTIHRHCVIVSDPGAGKTGLLWWTASTLAAQDKALPLFVTASKLRRLSSITLTDLCGIAEPPLELPPDELTDIEFYLLLDGLDELIGAEAGGDKIALELLAKTFRTIPPRTRVLAACRTPAFALIGDNYRGTLPRSESASSDRYARAITRALGLTAVSPLILRIEPVSNNDARTFLENRSVSQDLVHTATSSSNILPFLSSPFSLHMLTVALPLLASDQEIAIDDLYRSYVRAALISTDENLTDADLDGIYIALQQSVYPPRKKMSQKFEGLAERAGLLTNVDHELVFSHYSLWEYFFASRLFDEITQYDSRTLSRLDLVSGYNINRMLLPMLRRKIERNASPFSKKIRAVTASEYRDFLSDRAWRRDTGYGIHPSVAVSSDGTPSATFKVRTEDTLSIHRDRNHGKNDKGVAQALSWYDAAVFAMHTMTRIPTSREIEKLDCQDDYLFWCADWHTEEAAHVCVYHAQSGEIRGVNPDVRLSKCALAVVGNANSPLH